MSDTAINRQMTGRAISERFSTYVLWIVLAAGSFLMAVPFIWMFTTTLSPISEAFTLPPQWLPGSDITIESYLRALNDYPDLLRYFWNSVYISTLVTIGYVRLNPVVMAAEIREKALRVALSHHGLDPRALRCVGSGPIDFRLAA